MIVSMARSWCGPIEMGAVLGLVGAAVAMLSLQGLVPLVEHAPADDHEQDSQAEGAPPEPVYLPDEQEAQDANHVTSPV
jgi:hypothetical protein